MGLDSRVMLCWKWVRPTTTNGRIFVVTSCNFGGARCARVIFPPSPPPIEAGWRAPSSMGFPLPPPFSCGAWSGCCAFLGHGIGLWCGCGRPWGRLRGAVWAWFARYGPELWGLTRYEEISVGRFPSSEVIYHRFLLSAGPVVWDWLVLWAAARLGAFAGRCVALLCQLGACVVGVSSLRAGLCRQMRRFVPWLGRLGRCSRVRIVRGGRGCRRG